MVERIESNAQARQFIQDLREQALSSGVGGATDEAAAKIAFKQVSTLIASDSNVRVTSSAGNRTNEVGQMAGGTGIPEIDSPASATNVKDNLEKLLLFLQLDNDERMARMAKDRLEGEKATLQSKHDDMSKQISKNIDAIDEAAKKQQFMKIFGWVMFAVSAIVTIATCGAAIGAAVAATGAAAAATAATAATTAAATTAATTAGTTVAATAATTAAQTAAVEAARVAAQEAVKAAIKTCIQNAIAMGVSTTMQVAQETGDMKEWTKSLANSVKSTFGCTKEESEMWAQIIFGVGTMALSMGTGIAGAKNAATATSSAIKAGAAATEAGAQTATSLATKITSLSANLTKSTVAKVGMLTVATGLTATSMTGQGLSIKAQYEAGMSQADTRDIEAAIKLIEQMIAETQEELEQILEQEQMLLSQMFSIISSEMDAENEIAQNTGAMA